MARVRILEEAADEAIEAAAWYEEQQPGLGIEFAQAFHASLDLLEEEIPFLSPTCPEKRGEREPSGSF